MGLSELHIDDFTLIGLTYWIPVLLVWAVLFIGFTRFRSAWSLDRFWVLIAPGLIYGLLESLYQRQNWNFFIVDAILGLGAILVLILHLPPGTARHTRAALYSLSFLAVLLWLAIPSASLKLF